MVAHHLILTLPWFADRVELKNLGPKGEFEFSMHRLFEYSPLHILFGGTEAVVVFFVLSGYVLVFAIKKSNLGNYVLHRLIRLYTPIVTAVCVSSLLLLAQRRLPLQGASWWLNSHAITYSNNSLFRNLSVIDGTDWMNSSLWSMRYEIVFSLAVLVILGLKPRKSLQIFMTALCLISTLILLGMHFNLDLVSWLPVFFAGSALHLIPDRYSEKSSIKFLIGCFVMFIPWYFAGFGFGLNPGVSRVLMTFGAMFVVDSCRNESGYVSKILSMKLFQLAGKYSYSLYLIHVPILTSVWFVMGFTESNFGWLLRTFISIGFILIGTWVIFKSAEGPSLKWIKNKN